jgi:hypothetical protein
MAWALRDEDAADVFEVYRDAELVGVAVIGTGWINAGPTIDLMAAHVTGGGATRALQRFCRALAKHTGAVAVRMQSNRRVDRLPATIEPAETTFIHWIQ